MKGGSETSCTYEGEKSSSEEIDSGKKKWRCKEECQTSDERMEINEEDLDLKWKGTLVILEKKRKNRKKETNGRLTIEDCGSGTSRKYFLL